MIIYPYVYSYFKDNTEILKITKVTEYIIEMCAFDIVKVE
jgi:hypothetical protein